MRTGSPPSGVPAPTSRRGFTLIELLVVVATISILGSMTVPIFLEAKTRTRISKAKSDMRMVALGMETYFADHGFYPRPDDSGGNVIPEGDFSEDPYDTRIPSALTTPVSYIDLRYSDPFVANGTDIDRSYLLYTKPYFTGTVGEAAYQQYLQDALGPASVLQVEYIVVSRGPDLDHDEPVGHTWPTGDSHGDPNGPAMYDPTNGSISNGDVLYLGAGIGYNDE